MRVSDFKSGTVRKTHAHEVKQDILNIETLAVYQSHCKDLKLGVPKKGDIEIAKNLTNATPGDFANVTRQHRLRQFSNPREYIEAVLAECEIKEGAGMRKMGFV